MEDTEIFLFFLFFFWKIVIVKHSRAAEYRFISRPTKRNWRKGASVRKLSSQQEVFNRETELYGSAASSVTASAALTIEVNLPKCRTAPTDLRLGLWVATRAENKVCQITSLCSNPRWVSVKCQVNYKFHLSAVLPLLSESVCPKNANSVLHWSDFMRLIEPVSIKHLPLWLRFKNDQLENATLHFAISIHFPVVIFFKMHTKMPYRDSITAVLQLYWINCWEVVQICHVSPVITVKLIEMFVVVVVVFSKKKKKKRQLRSCLSHCTDPTALNHVHHD